VRFTPLPIDGAMLVELEPVTDARGSFARAWCAEEIEAHGGLGKIAQLNVSTNVRRGTLRGLHVQHPPHGEAKFFRCLSGRSYHVVADLRAASSTFGRWTAVELAADRFDALFAAGVFQRPKHITSFADGTKIAAEMACVANASGFGVSTRGMAGPRAERVEDAVDLFDAEALHEKGEGIVDYILGAEPSFGVFVLAHSDRPFHDRYMRIYKMGDGPIYTFYRPYHLSPLETPLSVARAVLFGDAAVTPLGAPVCEVVALAKTDLATATELDGVGGFTCFGMLENRSAARHEGLLPMGLSAGCRLLHDVKANVPLRFADVEVPPGRISDQLWHEQVAAFS
jgi:hypothetical protein